MKAILLIALIATSAYGIHIAECVKDISKIVDDATAIVNLAKSQSKDIDSYVSAIAQTLTDLNAALPTCGIKIPQKDMPGNFNNCISDVESVVELAQKLIQDGKAKDIGSLLDDLKNLYTIVSQTVADCKAEKTEEKLEISFHKVGSIIHTAGDVASAAYKVGKLVGTVASLGEEEPKLTMNVRKIAGKVGKVASVANTVISVAKFAGVLGEGEAEQLMAYQVGDLATCVDAGEVLVHNVMQFAADTKTKDVNSLADEAAALIKEVYSVFDSCGLEAVEQKIQQFVPADCVDSLDSTFKFGVKIYSEKDNFMQLLKDLPAFFQQVADTQAKCPALAEIAANT